MSARRSTGVVATIAAVALASAGCAGRAGLMPQPPELLGEPNRSRTAQGARSNAAAFEWVMPTGTAPDREQVGRE